MALFEAYFTKGQNPGSHEVLVRVAGEVGLDPAEAARILASDAYAAEVREREQFYQRQGINSVPAIIINDRHLISGGQPPEVFEQALRQILADGQSLMPTATWNGATIAEARDEVQIVENNVYFPLSAVKQQYLQPSAPKLPGRARPITTACWWTVKPIATRSGYHQPFDAAKQIADHLAFWKGVKVTR